MGRPVRDASLVGGWFGQFNYETNETRFLILEYILGHPENLPSVPELEYMLPSQHAEQLADELTNLQNAGYIDTYQATGADVYRDLPSEFVGLTTDGIEKLRNHGFLDIAPVVNTMYESLSKPDDIETYEQLPRPTLPTSITTAIPEKQT